MDQINKGFQTGPVHSLLENPKILYWPQHLVDRVGVILLGQCPEDCKEQEREFRRFLCWNSGNSNNRSLSAQSLNQVANTAAY